MNESFGGQGGFGEFIGATKNFGDHTGVFKTSVGEWAFGVLSLTKALGKLEGFGENVIKMTGVLGGLGQVFVSSKLIDVIADLANQIQGFDKTIQRKYGVFNKGPIGNEMVEATQNTLAMGINMRDHGESFVALARELQDFGRAMPLTEISSIIAKNFGIGSDAAASITSSFSKFGGRDAAEIESIMGGKHFQEYVSFWCKF